MPLRRAPVSALVAGVCALVAACGGEPWGEEDIPAGSARQATWSWWFQPPSPQLWVVLVDDAPTDLAREMRARLATEVIGNLDRYRRAYGPGDPAFYWPARVQVLVVPTSNPRAAVHGVIDARLNLSVTNATSETGREWEEALGEVIVGLESGAVEPNAVFSALRYWNEVISGERAPERTEDVAFVASILEPDWPWIFVVTTRDDESSIEVEDATLPNWSSSWWLGFVHSGAECTDYPELEVPRLDSRDDAYFRCDGDPLLVDYVNDVISQCMSPLPVALGDGQVACRVFAYAEPDLDCPEERGWLDPENDAGERVPTLVNHPTDSSVGERRVCEVRQLEGAALASCREEPSCSACEPGWCFREAWGYDHCAGSDEWDSSRLRFVLGATLTDAPTQLAVRCDVE